MIRERERTVMNGALMLLVGVAGAALACWWFISAIKTKDGAQLGGALLLFVTMLTVLAGLFTATQAKEYGFVDHIVESFGEVVPQRQRIGISS